MKLEKKEKIMYGFAIIILLLAIAISFIDKNSIFYLPLTYIAAGVVVIVVVIVITSVIKNKILISKNKR